MDDLKARGQRLFLWKWNDSPVRTFTNYNEDLRWTFRYDESIEQILNGNFFTQIGLDFKNQPYNKYMLHSNNQCFDYFTEPSASINEDESVKEFSNNSSNEQLTQVPMIV